MAVDFIIVAVDVVVVVVVVVVVLVVVVVAVVVSVVLARMLATQPSKPDMPACGGKSAMCSRRSCLPYQGAQPPL